MHDPPPSTDGFGFYWSFQSPPEFNPRQHWGSSTLHSNSNKLCITLMSCQGVMIACSFSFRSLTMLPVFWVTFYPMVTWHGRSSWVGQRSWPNWNRVFYAGMSNVSGISITGAFNQSSVYSRLISKSVNCGPLGLWPTLPPCTVSFYKLYSSRPSAQAKGQALICCFVPFSWKVLWAAPEWERTGTVETALGLFLSPRQEICIDCIWECQARCGLGLS